MAGPTATLRVERDAAPWRDKLRAYKIVVDGVAVGSVANGEAADVAMEPGRHTLRFQIDWAASPTIEFDLDDGHIVTYRCGPNGGAWTA